MCLNNKVKSVEEITQIIQSLRKEKKKIVFTNGCFDILHPGHIYCLKKAKLLGDILIIGLNSDSSVKSLKGEKRPILNEKERTTILSAIDCVDYIVLFHENTPYELIKAIKPDVLVKGSSYNKDNIVGKDIVEKNGGTVEIIPNYESYSTSDIIDRILKNNKENS